MTPLSRLVRLLHKTGFLSAGGLPRLSAPAARSWVYGLRVAHARSLLQARSVGLMAYGPRGLTWGAGQIEGRSTFRVLPASVLKPNVPVAQVLGYNASSRGGTPPEHGHWTAPLSVGDQATAPRPGWSRIRLRLARRAGLRYHSPHQRASHRESRLLWHYFGRES